MLSGENPYRLAIVVFALLQGTFGLYCLLRAGAAATILNRRGEGFYITLPLSLSYVSYCVGVLVYVIEPVWMEWSSIEVVAWVRWCGVALLLLGAVLSVSGMMALGRNLTFVPETKEEHSLVTTGPYRWVRHPLYTAFLAQIVGTGLLTANWIVLFAGLLTWGMLVVRTRIEEANLLAKFGEEYRDYMRRTGRFFPRMRRAD